MGKHRTPDPTPTQPTAEFTTATAVESAPVSPALADPFHLADADAADPSVVAGSPVDPALFDPSLLDVVPGDPPVPVTVWRVPAPQASRRYERLVTRLLATHTRPGDGVFDAGCDPALRRVAAAAGRRHHLQPWPGAPDVDAVRLPLAVAEWPLLRAGVDPVIVLGGIRGRLRTNGCLAVVVASAPSGEPPTELGPLVSAARAAGFTYRQHIVAVHAHADRDTLTPQPAPTRPAEKPRGGAAHLRIHTDVLLFTPAGGQHG